MSNFVLNIQVVYLDVKNPQNLGQAQQTFPDPYTLMKDRVAFVTGGSRGIGAATALLLGRSGARGEVNSSQHEAAAQTGVSTIEQAGGQALAIQADAAHAEQVEAMVHSVGGARSEIWNGRGGRECKA